MVREELLQFVREELVRRKLIEAPSVDDGDKDKKRKEDPEGGGRGEKKKLTPSPGQGSDKSDPPSGKKKEPAEPPVEDDPESDKTGPEAESDAEDEARSDISDEITGKTVQSITMEPKSKLMPGAQEIVLTFNEITDPLRIILTKSGRTAFYFRGMHNTL
jgi:hypothetical protein